MKVINADDLSQLSSPEVPKIYTKTSYLAGYKKALSDALDLQLEIVDPTTSELQTPFFTVNFDSDKLKELVDEVVEKFKSGELQITELPQGTWNPISESQPVIKGYYLTTTIHHEVYCDYWNGENFDRTEAVIAWMELPNPYYSEDNENETSEPI